MNIVFPSIEKQVLVKMLMTTAGLSSRCVTSSEDIYTLICHDFPKNVFLFALETPGLRHVMIVQDQGVMKYEPTHKCYNVIIAQCMSNNIL